MQVSSVPTKFKGIMAKNKIKKLTKAEVVQYYHRMAYPEQYGITFIPADLQQKAFEKLLNWQGVKVPETVKEENKLQKMTFEVRIVD